jgi:hypothetical protein
MSFQDIFEISQSISVQNHRTVGQQISRSGEIRVAEYLTSVPWVFTVKPHNFLYYPQARQTLAYLEVLDREIPDQVFFNSNNLKWFTSYQGALSAGQLSGLQLASVPPANSLIFTMKGLPTVASTTVMLKAGDFVQIGDYPYKVTQDVERGSASTVQVYVNRPIINTSALIVNSSIVVGNNVRFVFYMEAFPTYTLVPMTNGAFIQWDSDFVFREAVGYLS